MAAGPKPGQGVAVARNLLGSDGTDWLPKDEAWHRAGGHYMGLMGQNPGTPGEPQNSWDLWMFIPL